MHQDIQLEHNACKTRRIVEKQYFKGKLVFQEYYLFGKNTKWNKSKERAKYSDLNLLLMLKAFYFLWALRLLQ